MSVAGQFLYSFCLFEASNNFSNESRLVYKLKLIFCDNGMYDNISMTDLNIFLFLRLVKQ